MKSTLIVMLMFLAALWVVTSDTILYPDGWLASMNEATVEPGSLLDLPTDGAE